MFDLFKASEPEIPQIPAPIVAILASGFVVSAYILRLKPFSSSANGAWDLSSRLIVNTRWGSGSPVVLFLYRIVMLLWCLGLGLSHTINVGPRIFAYFTMWTWWLLTCYFLLTTAASVRSLRRPRSRKQTVDRLEYAVVAVLHVIVAAVLMVDTLTWLVLVPMLRSNPDPAKVAWAEKMFFNFYSYNTHAANLVFILGELFLNSIPFVPYLMGFLGVYVATFGVWSFTYFRLHGLWLYPFLDADQPWSVVAYSGIFVGCFIFAGLVGALFWLRDWLALKTRQAAHVAPESVKARAD